MSDYFAALLRASGLGQAPGTAASAGTELSVLDLEIPTVAAPVSRAPQTPAVRSVTLSPAPTPTVQTAAPVFTPVPDNHHEVDTPSNALATPTVPVAEPRTAQPVTASNEPVVAHQALVQSVMRWVAGDQPAQPSATVQEVPSSVATPALPGERPITPAIQPGAHALSTVTVARVETAEATSQSRQPLPAEAEPPVPAVRYESSPQQQAAALREQPEPEKTEPPSTDGLSISIGAIHLRVEAPTAPVAPQAAAKPAVQPAAARTTSTPPATTRSSLSRRALRRI